MAKGSAIDAPSELSARADRWITRIAPCLHVRPRLRTPRAYVHLRDPSARRRSPLTYIYPQARKRTCAAGYIVNTYSLLSPVLPLPRLCRSRLTGASLEGPPTHGTRVRAGRRWQRSLMRPVRNTALRRASRISKRSRSRTQTRARTRTRSRTSAYTVQRSTCTGASDLAAAR